MQGKLPWDFLVYTQWRNYKHIIITVWYAPTHEDGFATGYDEYSRSLVWLQLSTMDGSDNQMDDEEAFLPESHGYAVVRIENKSANGN